LVLSVLLDIFLTLSAALEIEALISFLMSYWPNSEGDL